MVCPNRHSTAELNDPGRTAAGGVAIDVQRGVAGKCQRVGQRRWRVSPDVELSRVERERPRPQRRGTCQFQHTRADRGATRVGICAGEAERSDTAFLQRPVDNAGGDAEIDSAQTVVHGESPLRAAQIDPSRLCASARRIQRRRAQRAGERDISREGDAPGDGRVGQERDVGR